MISVIICSINQARFARAKYMYGQLLAGAQHEIIGIHDATGLAEGYIRGAVKSKGEWVIFSHDDVQFGAPDFLQRLMGHMEQCDVLGIAGTRRMTDAKWIASGMPYAYGQVATPDPSDGSISVIIWSVPARRIEHIQALDGVFLCVRRTILDTVQFDANTFKGFHHYDLDFTFRAHLAGHRLVVATDLHAVHDSPGKPDAAWEADAQKFRAKFAALLAPPLPRSTSFCIVKVKTVEDMVDVMTPSHWMD
ncbi:MAG TPA: glycosyltransferase [Humisphaera sp.]|jgi:GT2 family glycosyltransferase|nr:glycosyltransferase [Humisphaera sp.]